MLSSSTPEFSLILKRSARRKSAAIQVFPDGRVVISIPERMSEERARTWVTLKKPWILKTLAKFATLPPPAPENKLVSGEKFLYLGEEKTLEIAEGVQLSPYIEGDLLRVGVPARVKPEQRTKYIRTTLETWYRGQALDWCTQRIHVFSEQMKLFPKHVEIKNYKARWGTCKSTGEITFNWRLAMAPLWVIDYVVIHELAHLRYPHHRPTFWNLVMEYAENPKRAKNWLKHMDHQGRLKI